MIDLTSQLDRLTGAAGAALDRGESVQFGDVVIVRRHSSYVAERNGSVFASWSSGEYGQWCIIREAIFAAMREGEP